MVTLAQRLEELRTEAGLSRPALAAALGFPKGSIEKFETGRQTPTKEQQERIAGHFGLSLFYLRGESGDRTRMDDWMSGAYREEEPGHVPTPARQPRPKAPAPEPASGGQSTVLDAMLSGSQFRSLLRSVVLDVLSSPEGQELVARVVRKELSNRR